MTDSHGKQYDQAVHSLSIVSLASKAFSNPGMLGLCRQHICDLHALCTAVDAVGCRAHQGDLGLAKGEEGQAKDRMIRCLMNTLLITDLFNGTFLY